MMKNIIFFFFVLQFQFVFTQNMNFLTEQNGFRDIKLGSNINNYSDFIEKEKNTVGNFNEYLYIGNKYKKIDQTDVLKISVSTIDDLIYEIEIITDKTTMFGI
ncbi:hypothetical protein OMO38_10960 [Chryseobacterium sp. 09-1422]|uniref:Uncharacterized protein n=1 Tax=Chryseobacterium kimseyorum TaxID=2984028 RepID=A0ABT3HZ57_9FLAO|nr:hypothetical protein [Chryseobacterium kimseyorum]MCW3169044.1 hypothetical protein [Chryseobacterium kimseyorum]